MFLPYKLISIYSRQQAFYKEKAKPTKSFVEYQDHMVKLLKAITRNAHDMVRDKLFCNCVIYPNLWFFILVLSRIIFTTTVYLPVPILPVG